MECAACEEEPAGSASEASPSSPPAAAPEICDASDFSARVTYEAWKTAPNAFGSLAGATFSGYLENGPDVALVIGSDQTAVLIVGEPAAINSWHYRSTATRAS